MNNPNQLIACPIVENIDYRSNIDSSKLTEMIRSIEESSVRAVLKTTLINENLNMLSLGINASYKALNRSSQIYNSYPTTSDIYSSTSFVGCAYATAFGEIDGVRQDKTAGIVTIDWNDNKKLSKIPIYEGVVSPSLQIYIDDILRTEGDKVYNIVDNDPNTIWVEAATSGTHTIELVLPPSINKTFNYIEIIPFPIYGMEITKIEYYDLRGTLKTIYPTNENSFYSSYGPLVFHTYPREYNNTIKITVNVLEGINAMGFSKIDICDIDYLNNTNTVYLKFENIPQVDIYGNTVTEIIPTSIDIDFYADGIVNDSFDQFIPEISLVSTPSSSTAIGLKRTKGYQTIPSSTFTLGEENGKKCMYLKFVMNEVNYTTPVLRGAKMNFTYGTII